MPVFIRARGQCVIVGFWIWRIYHDLGVWNDTFDVGVVYLSVHAGANEEILFQREISLSSRQALTLACLDIVVDPAQSKIAVRCLKGKV